MAGTWPRPWTAAGRSPAGRYHGIVDEFKVGAAGALTEIGSVTGRLAPEDLTPQMREEFVDLFRRWQSEQQ